MTMASFVVPEPFRGTPFALDEGVSNASSKYGSLDKMQPIPPEHAFYRSVFHLQPEILSHGTK